MSRYIDAELVPALFDKEYKETRKLIQEGETHLDNLAEGFSEAARVIRTIPTADAVEVVRCKDCLHHPENGGECDRSITHTSRDYICEVNTYRYIGLDFCSYGERRKEDEGK